MFTSRLILMFYISSYFDNKYMEHLWEMPRGLMLLIQKV